MSYPETVDNWLECLALPEYLAKIPAGHVLMITGEEFWIDGNGVRMTTEEYKRAWPGVDPAVVWAAKKRYLAEHGGGVRPA